MSGNGHKTIDEAVEEKVFEGVTINIGELQRQDGQIAEAIDKASAHNLGVIQTVIHAVNNDDDYRQILKLAIWKNTEEQDKAVNALSICRLTGAKKAMRTILDRITARSAGINGALIHEAFEALTHTTFTQQTLGGSKKRWHDDREKSNSPLSA